MVTDGPPANDTLPSASQKIGDSLNAQPKGAAWDQAYMNNEVAVHQAVVSLLQTAQGAAQDTALKALIKGMMKTQLIAETNPDEALTKLVGTYYKTSMENARIAKGKQPAVVDARAQTDFILARTDSIMEMGYIKKKPGRDAIDWTLLEQVIAENKDLYDKLKYKAA